MTKGSAAPTGKIHPTNGSLAIHTADLVRHTLLEATRYTPQCVVGCSGLTDRELGYMRLVLQAEGSFCHTSLPSRTEELRPGAKKKP